MPLRAPVPGSLHTVPTGESQTPGHTLGIRLQPSLKKRTRTPLHPYNPTPVHPYTRTPLHLYTHPYTPTPLHQYTPYTRTLVHKHRCTRTPVHTYTRTPGLVDMGYDKRRDNCLNKQTLWKMSTRCVALSPFKTLSKAQAVTTIAEQKSVENRSTVFFHSWPGIFTCGFGPSKHRKPSLAVLAVHNHLLSWCSTCRQLPPQAVGFLSASRGDGHRGRGCCGCTWPHHHGQSFKCHVGTLALLILQMLIEFCFGWSDDECQGKIMQTRTQFCLFLFSPLSFLVSSAYFQACTHITTFFCNSLEYNFALIV